MNKKHCFYVLCILTAGLVYNSLAQGISITGTVKDAGAKGIAGASVRLVSAGITATTDANGAYSIVSTQGILSPLARAFLAVPVIRGQSLSFAVANTQLVRIRMYDLKGRLAADLVNASLTSGEYRLPLVAPNLASKIYLVKAELGARTTVCKFTFVNRGAISGGLARVHDYGAPAAAAKRTASVDTLSVTASGYKGTQTGIGSYSGTYDFVLQKAAFDIAYPGFDSRVFKSPGGAIIFEWNPMAGATGYAVAADGKTVADNIPAGVTFAEVALADFAGTAVFGVHSWSVAAKTAAGDQASSTCSFTIAEAVDGTTGAPLGGIGSGAVKFCPWKGEFAFQAKTPAGQEDYVQQPNWQFSLYTKRGATVLTNAKLSAVKRTVNTKDRYDDDAIFPVEYANFGATNDVSVTLTAFAPYNLADQKKMTYPLAFYHLTLRNLKDTPVEAACAFQVSTDQAPVAVSGKGFAAGGATEKAVFVKCSDAAAVVSSGNDAGFLASGTLNNAPSGTVNMAAAKVTLGPGEKKNIQFVLAWYKSDDPAGYYYSNFQTSANAFAQAGLDNYDDYETRAVQFVERFRASNVPDWVVNTTLDQTIWTNSSIYTKDGRYSEWEGHYTWFGQMDQGWHAFASNIWRINGTMFSWPNAAYMEFWARTEMVGGTSDGQISHDFAPTGAQVTDHKTCQWDAPGYHGWGGADWPDLDCGFLYGVYESFVATGDKTRMDYYWPFFKRTAERLYRMASSLNQNTTYPFTFQGTGATYDKGTQNHDLYNSGLALTAFKIIAEMAGVYGDTAMQNRFTTAYSTGISSFKQRYLANPSAGMTPNQETPFAGLWMSLYFHKDQMFSDDEIGRTFTYLFNNFWHPLDQGMAASGANGESEGWVPYVVGHLGGACLTTNRVAEWRAIQKDFYNRYFGKRDRVFNGDIYLAYSGLGDNFASGDWSGHNFYCSMPVVWRTYYSLIGFWFNAWSKELYVEPKLPATSDKWGTSMNHELKNALFCVPGYYGTIFYKESGNMSQDQDIIVRFDKPTQVSAIYISDRALPMATMAVTVNGAARPFTRTGTGASDRRIKIDWTGTVDSSGVRISAVDQGMSDATPPLAFTLVSPANGSTVQNTMPVLAWRKSSDPESGIQRYDVFVNNSKIASTTDTSYAFTAITPGTFTWYVSAVNWVDKSTSSPTQTFVYADATPPSVFSLVTPADNATVTGPAVSFFWQTALDNGTGMDHYEFSLDNVKVATVACDTGSMSYGNLALGKTATASSVAQGNEAKNAVDGSSGTRWESSAADNQWLCIDLGAPSQIDSVTLSWEAAYASSYEIDVTNDTTNWTGKAVYQTTTGAGGKESIKGLNAIGRYARILCIKRGTGWGNSIYEFGVYGMPLATYSATSVSAGAHTWNVTAVDKAGNKTVAKKVFLLTIQ